MINTWFTSDFHLGHQNIIRYCSRPFHSTGEMDEGILGNLNSMVRQNDVLYFLGDFCMGGPDHAARLNPDRPLHRGRNHAGHCGGYPTGRTVPARERLDLDRTRKGAPPNS